MAVQLHLLQRQVDCCLAWSFVFWCTPRNVDQKVYDMLSLVFSHINRDDHCERHGFLHLVRGPSSGYAAVMGPTTAAAVCSCTSRIFPAYPALRFCASLFAPFRRLARS